MQNSSGARVESGLVQHFLSVSQFTRAELEALLELAARLKHDHLNGGNQPLLRGKTLVMLFQKPSLRTRVSFEMAMRHLGGSALTLLPGEVSVGKRETVADAARVLSGYVDGIMARMSSHTQLLKLAHHASVPVINGLTDYNHPAQALCDMFTLREEFRRLEGLKLAYVGDGNNVATSLLAACMLLGIHFYIACPAGYELSRSVVARALELRASAGTELVETTSAALAVAGADVVYTDAWISMGQEDEAAERMKVFPPYQVNSSLLARAKPNARVMHCLPAHRGDEITDDVADGPQSLMFVQAHNRLHGQKAIVAHFLG